MGNVVALAGQCPRPGDGEHNRGNITVIFIQVLNTSFVRGAGRGRPPVRATAFIFYQMSAADYFPVL